MSVLSRMDGLTETDTGANQYQLATAADKDQGARDHKQAATFETKRELNILHKFLIGLL